MVRKRRPWNLLGSESKRLAVTPIVKQLDSVARDHGTEVETVAANIVKRCNTHLFIIFILRELTNKKTHVFKRTHVCSF